jgi:hypothetical protein
MRSSTNSICTAQPRDDSNRQILAPQWDARFSIASTAQQTVAKLLQRPPGYYTGMIGNGISAAIPTGSIAGSSCRARELFLIRYS